MKSQHQISFKRRRTGRPRPRTKTAASVRPPPDTADVTAAQVTIGERELHFARALSDTERDVRDAALASLRDFLSRHAKVLTSTDLDKLWKGLFYCIWMADKRPVITATIANVIELTDILGWPFLEALFRCVVREWFGVDKHRVDKYYELINAALRESVGRVVEAEGKGVFFDEVLELQKMLRESIWERVSQSGLGVALHLLDVYTDDIMRPILLPAAKLPGNDVHKIFDLLLIDLYSRMGSAEGHLLAVGKRIQERVLGRLIGLLRDEEVGLKKKDQRDMMMRASKRVFAVAANKETADDLRKGLYDLRTELKAFVTAYDEERAACKKAAEVTKDQSTGKEEEEAEGNQ